MLNHTRACCAKAHKSPRDGSTFLKRPRRFKVQKMRRNVAFELLILIIIIDALSKTPFFENFDPRNSKSTLYRHSKPPLKSKKPPKKILKEGPPCCCVGFTYSLAPPLGG